MIHTQRVIHNHNTTEIMVSYYIFKNYTVNNTIIYLTKSVSPKMQRWWWM